MNIRVKKNIKMKQYLASMKMDYKQQNIADLSTIDFIVFPRFVEWDNCVLLKQKESIDLPQKFVPNAFCPDRTALEAMYNHIHFNDLLNTSLGHDSILDIGIKVMETWTSALYTNYGSNKKITIVLSTDGEEVTLRFYTMRDNEPSWLRLSQLENYIEGLMIAEIKG